MSMKEAEVLDQKIEVLQKGLLSLSVPTGETTQMSLVTGECWWIGAQEKVLIPSRLM